MKTFIYFILLLVFILSCNSETERKADNITYHFDYFTNDILYQNKIHPDTNYNFVLVFLPSVFCEPCKTDITEFLNELFMRIKGVPKENICVVTDKMRKQELKYFFSYNYPIKNRDSINICMSDTFYMFASDKIGLTGAFVIVYAPQGKIIYKKQFKQTVSYYNDIDSIVHIILERPEKGKDK